MFWINMTWVEATLLLCFTDCDQLPLMQYVQEAKAPGLGLVAANHLRAEAQARRISHLRSLMLTSSPAFSS